MFVTKSLGWRVSSLTAGLLAAAALAGCGPKAVTGQTQVVEGVRFDYGLVPEAAPGAPPAGQPDMRMNSAAPAHANSYHVVLSVADAKTGQKLEPPEVTMSLSGPDHPGKVSVAMDPMTVNGQATYGHYVQLPHAGPYQLEFHVRPAGGYAPIKARFELERPS
jgi:hypothetical protein